MADNTYTFNRELHARDEAAPALAYSPASLSDAVKAAQSGQYARSAGLAVRGAGSQLGDLLGYSTYPLRAAGGAALDFARGVAGDATPAAPAAVAAAPTDAGPAPFAALPKFGPGSMTSAPTAPAAPQQPDRPISYREAILLNNLLPQPKVPTYTEAAKARLGQDLAAQRDKELAFVAGNPKFSAEERAQHSERLLNQHTNRMLSLYGVAPFQDYLAQQAIGQGGNN